MYLAHNSICYNVILLYTIEHDIIYYAILYTSNMNLLLMVILHWKQTTLCDNSTYGVPPLGVCVQ